MVPPHCRQVLFYGTRNVFVSVVDSLEYVFYVLIPLYSGKHALGHGRADATRTVTNKIFGRGAGAATAATACCVVVAAVPRHTWHMA